MSLDLLGELRVLSLPFVAARMLIDLGVPAEVMLALHGNGDLALGQVELDPRGRFEFGGPDRRLILTVRDAAGEVVDLVALASHDENQWALRTGLADLLGDDQLLDAVLAERRELRLHPTPLAWLRAGCEGICVLDWTRSALGALRGMPEGLTLVVDPGWREGLKAKLAYGGLPRVAEVQTLRRVA